MKKRTAHTQTHRKGHFLANNSTLVYILTKGNVPLLTRIKENLKYFLTYYQSLQLYKISLLSIADEFSL